MAKRVAMKLSLSKHVTEMLELQVAAGLYPDASTAVEQAVLRHARVRSFSSEEELVRIVEESERSGKPRPLTDRDFQRLHDMIDRVSTRRKPARRKSA